MRVLACKRTHSIIREHILFCAHPIECTCACVGMDKCIWINAYDLCARACAIGIPACKCIAHTQTHTHTHTHTHIHIHMHTHARTQTHTGYACSHTPVETPVKMPDDSGPMRFLGAKGESPPRRLCGRASAGTLCLFLFERKTRHKRR